MPRSTRTLALVTLVALAATAIGIALWPRTDVHSHTVALDGGTLTVDGPGWRLDPPARPEVVHLALGTCRSTSERAHLQVRTPFGVLHATGPFHATIARDGDRFCLRATNDGGALRLDRTAVAPGQTIERPVTRGASGDPTPAAPIAQIAGHVIGTDGEPASTRVRLVTVGRVVAEVDSDASGAFAFPASEHAPPGSLVHVVAGDATRIAVAPAAAQSTLALGFATSMQGVVVGAAGEAWSGAVVEILATDPRAPAGWSLGRATTDAEGRFAIGGLPPIVVAIRVAGPDGAAHVHLDVDLAGEPMLVTLRPLPQRTLRGTTRDRDGNARAARVTIDVAGHTIAAADAGDDGTFAIDYRVAGSPARPTLPARARAGGSTGATAFAWARPATRPIEIVVDDATTEPTTVSTNAPRVPAVGRPLAAGRGAIRGRVDGAGGVGAALRVRVQAVGAVTRGIDILDGGGAFRIDELPPGRYRVVVRTSDGGGAIRDDVAVDAGASTDVGAIAPRPGAVLRVTALGAGDAPIAHDALLESTDAHDAPLVVGRAVHGDWPTGTVAFGPVPMGRYRIRVFPRDRTRRGAEETIVLDTPEALHRIRCPGR